MLTPSLRSGLLITVILGCACVTSAAEVVIGNDKSQPESLTATANGTLVVGSAASPFIYKKTPDAATASKFVDASSEGAGTFFFGMLADASGNSFWACQSTPVPNTKPTRRHTALRQFDLSTGAQKMRWDLPGDNSMCNDFSVGPDKALYITDTVNAKIYRLPAGAATAELFLEHPLLRGIDGITFLNGILYVNNVVTNHLYRIPVSESGKAGEPVDISLSQPVQGPDGMRAANGKLFLAENGSGRVSEVAINGDKGTVTVLKEGLKTPTAVEPAGDVVWIAERGAGKAVSISMPR